MAISRKEKKRLASYGLDKTLKIKYDGVSNIWKGLSKDNFEAIRYDGPVSVADPIPKSFGEGLPNIVAINKKLIVDNIKFQLKYAVKKNNNFYIPVTTLAKNAEGPPLSPTAPDLTTKVLNYTKKVGIAKCSFKNNSLMVELMAVVTDVNTLDPYLKIGAVASPQVGTLTFKVKCPKGINSSVKVTRSELLGYSTATIPPPFCSEVR